jgi:Holliday junction resolvase RusA-like endonuclease
VSEEKTDKHFIKDWHQFHIPGKPVPLERARVTRFGTYTPKRSADYRKLIQAAIKAQWKEAPLSEPLRVEMTFSFEKPKSARRIFHDIRPDLSNLVKAVEDSLNKILWVDDCQIVKVFACKQYAEQAGVDIHVYVLGD